MSGAHRRCLALALGALLPLALVQAGCGRSVTDLEITEVVSNRLESDPELGPHDVEVETRDGVVTLTGRVDQPAQRGEAEQIARRTDGVRDVLNLIEAGREARTPDVGAGPGERAPADPVD